MARKIGIVSTFVKIVKEVEKAEKRKINEIEKAYRKEQILKEHAEKEEKAKYKQQEKQKMLMEKEKAIDYANKMTIESEDERVKINSILKDVINKKIKIDWEDYIETNEFKKFNFVKPKLENSFEKPKREDYVRKLNFLERILPFYKCIKEKQDTLNYIENLKKWEIKTERIKSEYENAEKHYNLELDKWILEKNKFEDEKEKNNKIIKKQKELYEVKDKDGVEFYFNEILNNSEYPEYFIKEFDLEYNEDNKIIVIDYYLPNKNNLPKLKVMKYIITRKEFSETEIKEKEIDNMYDSVLYQLALRTNYEVYKSDYKETVNSIVFNGWIKDVSKATGKEEIKCILSLQTIRKEFMELELGNVDPKSCFQKLKGISSVKLSDLVPIAPIIKIDKNDNRFIEAYSVANKIEGKNLAAMDWEDFEHLIRELFEKEFAINGSEVKITQSSRDGGVDAVMFDPDPIRGGKFVIQAKRYTNVVGVSAVRDLYGTLMNEGASKGILVTTANFGADSYEFAKDKPITLINGNNLLFMLNKHGYNAKIDLLEAKQSFNNKK